MKDQATTEVSDNMFLMHLPAVLFLFICFGVMAFSVFSNEEEKAEPTASVHHDGDVFKMISKSEYVPGSNHTGDVAVAKGVDLSKGKALYATCIACHGDKAQGNPILKAPALRYNESWYIVSQLKHFKAGIRGANPKDIGGSMMAPMAKMLPDEQAMKDVAAYIGSFKNIKSKKLKATLKGNVSKGKALYATCLACHGDKLQGNPALKAPSLRGQDDWYIVGQLKNFKAGIRGANPKDAGGLMMAPMAKMLSDEQAMKDVAAYILSVK